MVVDGTLARLVEEVHDLGIVAPLWLHMSKLESKSYVLYKYTQS